MHRRRLDQRKALRPVIRDVPDEPDRHGLIEQFAALVQAADEPRDLVRSRGRLGSRPGLLRRDRPTIDEVLDLRVEAHSVPATRIAAR